jgi:hypothetical protein
LGFFEFSPAGLPIDGYHPESILGLELIAKIELDVMGKQVIARLVDHILTQIPQISAQLLGELKPQTGESPVLAKCGWTKRKHVRETELIDSGKLEHIASRSLLDHACPN